MPNDNTARRDDTGEEFQQSESSEAADATGLAFEDAFASDVALEEFLEAATGTEEPPRAPVSVNSLFGLLAAPGNRFVLTYLLRVGDPAAFEKLVAYVVDRAESPAGRSSAEFSGQVAARLVHSNLPKLEDAGLIEYDEESRTVASTPAIESVAPYLALAAAQSADRG